MKKAKRLLSLAAAAVMMSGILAMPASAANIQDTAWGFAVTSINTEYRTPLREKTNASGVYVFYKTGTESTLWCDVLNSENQSETRGKIGYVPKGQPRLVMQWVYEDGFRTAKLELGPTQAQGQGGVSGVWSPDSVGSYPYCN